MCTATLPAPKAKKAKTKPAFVPFRPLTVKLKNYDWVIVNTSGGKDSQTLLRQVVAKARAEGYPLDRIVPVHADLGSRVEWDGVRELVEEQCRHYGLEPVIVSRPQGDLLEEVRQRAMSIWRDAIQEAGEVPAEGFEERKEQVVRLYGPKLDGVASPWPSSGAQWCTAHQKANQVEKVMTALVKKGFLASPWPSQKTQWCTADQKRGQVSKVMTNLADRSRQAGVKRRVRILNCMGMRGQESTRRSKQKPFRLNHANGRRVVHDWLPLFNHSIEEVWADIKASGVRHHPAYDLGMGRLSCAFCIYAPRPALMLAGKHNRSKLDEYVKVEQEVGSRFRVELTLLEVRDALDRGEECGPVTSWEMP